MSKLSVARRQDGFDVRSQPNLLKEVLACVLGAVTLASCGGGGGAAGPDQSEWIDPGRIQVFGSADAVEMGASEAVAYVSAGGQRRELAAATAGLSFIGDSGPPPPGAQIQWLRFELLSENYFASQGQHLPIVLRFAQYPDPRVTRTEPVAVEGKMVFLGRDDGGFWDCPTPSAIGVYFETRVSGDGVQPDLGAVKCAADAPGLHDGVRYIVELRAGAASIGYTIKTADGQVLSAATSGDLEYPPTPWNERFLSELLDPAAEPFYRDRYRRLDEHREFAFLAAFTNTTTPWSLRFSAIESGWQ